MIQEKRRLNLINPLVELQMVCTKHNENEVNEFILLAKKLGADLVSVKSLYIDSQANELYKKKLVYEFLPNNGISRYYVDNTGKIKLKAMGPCPFVKQSVVTSDGDVVMCCFDTFGKFKFGNLLENNFKKIWLNKKFKDFRKNVMNNRKLDLCKSCIYYDCPSIDINLNQ